MKTIVLLATLTLASCTTVAAISNGIAIYAESQRAIIIAEK